MWRLLASVLSLVACKQDLRCDSALRLVPTAFGFLHGLVYRAKTMMASTARHYMSAIVSLFRIKGLALTTALPKALEND